MTNVSMCNSQLEYVCSGFLQSRATVIETVLQFIKRMKVTFELTSLPDDESLINHVTDILHIQWNMYYC